MKIGWVVPGGVDRSGRDRVIPVFLGLLERLTKHAEVHVFALQQGNRPDSFLLRGATVHELGDAGRRTGGATVLGRVLRMIVAEHRLGRFDALHGLWANQSGFAAVLAGRLLGVRSVVSIGGGELVALPEIGYGGALSWKTRFQARVSLRLAGTVTGATRYALAPASTVRTDAVHLPLGVDVDLYCCPAEMPPVRPCHLLQVAHLNPVKDQPTLLRAFACIRAEEPASKLTVMGVDTLGGRMQNLAVELGIADDVAFHGCVTGDEVAKAYRRSHLLLHTARHEAGPVAFLEAAASGLAAAGTRVGYVSDLAPHAAVAVPVGDEKRLAAETLRLMRDESARGEVAARARKFAIEHDADWTVRQLTTLYARTN